MKKIVLRHPLVAHKISILRNKDTPPKLFRELISELTLLLLSWASEELNLIRLPNLECPNGQYEGFKIKEEVGVFPIMRAGLGMVDSVLKLIPSSRIYHMGLYREKTTLLPVEYYNKLPAKCNVDIGFVLDPVVATAGTAIATVTILKDWGLKNIKFICCVGSKDGIQTLMNAHPDITVHVACIDDIVSDSGYIIPGIGDAGNRLFNAFD
jgi:uracil phosphoribosyltransferase